MNLDLFLPVVNDRFKSEKKIVRETREIFFGTKQARGTVVVQKKVKNQGKIRKNKAGKRLHIFFMFLHSHAISLAIIL